MGRKALLISLVTLLLMLIPGSASLALSLASRIDVAPPRYGGILPLEETPAPRLVKVRFEGTISQITPIPDSEDVVWNVGDVDVTITAETVIAPDGYQATVGDKARVEAIMRRGRLVGLEVSIHVGPIIAQPIEFTGVIESIQGSENVELVIGGVRVATTATTEFVGERLQVGSLAQVTGDLQADKSILAYRIDTSSPDTAAVSVEFEDEIRDIQAEYWLLGALGHPSEWRKVWIANAEIPNQGHVGLAAEVQGYKRQDGSIDATHILVEEINPSDETMLSGSLVAMGAETWTLDTGPADRVIKLDGNTFVDESRAPAVPGNTAYVTAISLQDDSLLAIRIRMERPE